MPGITCILIKSCLLAAVAQCQRVSERRAEAAVPQLTALPKTRRGHRAWAEPHLLAPLETVPRCHGTHCCVLWLLPHAGRRTREVHTTRQGERAQMLKVAGSGPVSQAQRWSYMELQRGRGGHPPLNSNEPAAVHTRCGSSAFMTTVEKTC